MDQHPVVFINAFEVEPERQSELVAILQEGANQIVRHHTGFTGLALYASQDGRRVVNVAHWENLDAAGMTQSVPQAAAYTARAAAISTATPGLFTLVAEIR